MSFHDELHKYGGLIEYIGKKDYSFPPLRKQLAIYLYNAGKKGTCDYIKEVIETVEQSLSKSGKEVSEEVALEALEDKLLTIATEVERNKEIAKGAFTKQIDRTDKESKSKNANVYEVIVADTEQASDVMNQLFLTTITGSKGRVHIIPLIEDSEVYLRAGRKLNSKHSEAGITAPLLNSSAWMEHINGLDNNMVAMDACSDPTQKNGRAMSGLQERATRKSNKLCREKGVKLVQKMGGAKDNSRKAILNERIGRAILTIQGTAIQSFGGRFGEYLGEVAYIMAEAIDVYLNRLYDLPIKAIQKDAKALALVSSQSYTDFRDDRPPEVAPKKHIMGRVREGLCNLLLSKLILDMSNNSARKERTESTSSASTWRHRLVEHGGVYQEPNGPKTGVPAQELEVDIKLKQSKVRAITDDLFNKITGLNMNATHHHMADALEKFAKDELPQIRQQRLRNVLLSHSELLEPFLITAYKHSQFLENMAWYAFPSEYRPQSQSQIKAWAGELEKNPNPTGPIKWHHVRQLVAKIHVEELNNRRQIFKALCVTFPNQAKEKYGVDIMERIDKFTPSGEDMVFLLPQNAKDHLLLELERQEQLLHVMQWVRSCELSGYNLWQIFGKESVDFKEIENGGMDFLTNFMAHLMASVNNSFDSSQETSTKCFGINDLRKKEFEEVKNSSNVFKYGHNNYNSIIEKASEPMLLGA